MLAIDAGIIPDGSNLHDFQIECANIVMECAGDVIVVSSTGSGKSLVWLLPLLARQGGVSLVITPYTSLGLNSEIRYSFTFTFSANFILGTMGRVYHCCLSIQSRTHSKILSMLPALTCKSFMHASRWSRVLCLLR